MIFSTTDHNSQGVGTNRWVSMGLARSVGVSDRLDESVVGELDTRAKTKLKQLQSDGPRPQRGNGRHALRFQRDHETQFAKMDSIDHHYLATPKRPMAGGDQGSSAKRIKRLVPQSPPQISEITKRVRRLRIRNNHDSSTQVRDTKLTAQRPMEPPGLLRSSANCLNRPQSGSTKPSAISGSVFDRLYAPKPMPKSTSFSDVRSKSNRTLVKSETSKSLARPTWK